MDINPKEYPDYNTLLERVRALEALIAKVIDRLTALERDPDTVYSFVPDREGYRLRPELSPEQRARDYAALGFVVIPGLFNPQDDTTNETDEPDHFERLSSADADLPAEVRARLDEQFIDAIERGHWRHPATAAPDTAILTSRPEWGCEQWGQPGHAWLDCQACMDGYDLELAAETARTLPADVRAHLAARYQEDIARFTSDPHGTTPIEQLGGTPDLLPAQPKIVARARGQA